MSKLEFYHAVPSRGFVVHWLLEELGVEYQLNCLDLEAQEHKTPEFLAINPLGKVPALVHKLVHGSEVVTETAAICLYLAETMDAGRLTLPVGHAHRGAFLRWLFFAPVTAEPSIIMSAMGQGGSDAGYQPFADLSEVAAVMVAALEGREFLLDDRFTVADVMLGSTINWGLNLMPVLPKHPVLVDYWARLAQRPAWQVVQATMSATTSATTSPTSPGA